MKQTPFDFDAEAKAKAEQLKSMKIEKDNSYYFHCRNRMDAIAKQYRIALFYTIAVAFLVSFTAAFKVRYQVFSVFANMFGPADNFVSIFCGGLSQIMMVCLLLLFGYLAWGHFRKLHLLIFAVYALMVLLGIWNDFDWLSIAIGLGGVLINIYAMMGMSEEEHLSALEGYPEFQAPLQLSKDDFVKPAAKPDAPDRDVKYIAAQKERAKREREKADAALAQSLAAKQPAQKAEASKATPIADEADSLHTLFDPVKDTALFAPKEENTKENAHDISRN